MTTESLKAKIPLSGKNAVRQYQSRDIMHGAQSQAAVKKTDVLTVQWRIDAIITTTSYQHNVKYRFRLAGSHLKQTAINKRQMSDEKNEASDS